MALGTNHVIVTEVQNFVPELWSDEVIASYKRNIVVRNLVRVLNHKGKKGDTIRIPTPTRAEPSDKVAETQVTLIQHGTDAGITIVIDKHKEYSRLIEDIVDVQALGSLRRFYTDDAGYSISRRIDKDLVLELFRGGQAGGTVAEGSSGEILENAASTNILTGDGSTAWDYSANNNGADAGNAVDLTDLGIRRFIKKLDDVDAPQMDRVLVIPTVVKQDMLGFARYTEQAFTGESGSGNSIRNGLIGDVYGTSVFVTTQLPLIESDNDGLLQVGGVYFQRDGVVFVEQMGVRSQTQYKQEYLADLYTSDVIYGYKTVRPLNVVPFVVPTIATEA